jgi:hypothetical protein
MHELGMVFLSLSSLVLPEKVPSAALSFVVATPAEGATVISYCDGMVLTSGHHGHGHTLKVFHSFWKADVFLVTDSQLPMVVESPSVNLLSLVDVEGVVVAGPHILGIASCDTLDHQGLLVLVTSDKHASEFPALRITPSKDLSISGQSQGMVSPRSNSLEARSLLPLIE